MEDINVLIKDKKEYGFGYVYETEGKLQAIMYQSRIDLEAKEEDAIEYLGSGKAYTDVFLTVLECINAIREFWFLPPLETMPEIKEYFYAADAVKDNPNASFICYQMSQSQNLATEPKTEE